MPPEECPAPIAKNGTFAWLPDLGLAGAWTLACNPGYRPDPRIGNLFFCPAVESNDFPTPVCEVDPGCMGADAIPSGSSATGTTCGEVIGESDTCEAVCDGAAPPVGAFVCSSGQILHMSYCVGSGEVVTNETVEKVAGTISIELDPQPTAAFMKSAFAAAFDAPEESVHGVQWTLGRRLLSVFLGSEGRRLDTKYAVSYEVIVPANSSATAIVLLAGRLAVDGTAESQALKASLLDNGIVAGAVQQVVAPRLLSQIVVRTASGVVPMPASPDAPLTGDAGDSSNLTGPVIVGAVVVFLALFVVGLVCYCACNGRRRKSEF